MPANSRRHLIRRLKVNEHFIYRIQVAHTSEWRKSTVVATQGSFHLLMPLPETGNCDILIVFCERYIVIVLFVLCCSLRCKTICNIWLVDTYLEIAVLLTVKSESKSDLLRTDFVADCDCWQHN